MKAAWRSPCMRWQHYYDYLKDMSHNVRKACLSNVKKDSPRRWYRAAMSRDGDVTNRRSESGRLIYRRTRDERLFDASRSRSRSRVCHTRHSLSLIRMWPYKIVSLDDAIYTLARILRRQLFLAGQRYIIWKAVNRIRSPSAFPPSFLYLYLLYDKRE